MDKKYDVYGIGNALVDLQFKVSKTFLETHGVKKGLMTLVDEPTQNRLMNAIDEKQTEYKSGGSAANTLIAVSQFGGKTFYSCKVADDFFGDFYLKDLNDAGIRTNFHKQERPEGITGKCLVMITDDADRTMNTYLGVTSDLSVHEVDEEAISQSKYIYIEGYLVASNTAHEAMKLAKKIADEQGVKTALTLSDPSIVKAFNLRLDEVISPAVDLLFCNQDEAMQYTGLDRLEEAAQALQQAARSFVITRGPEGALIYDGEQFIEVDAHSVQAVDTNGAGDMYAGAFLYGITHGMDYKQAGELASKAGARIVSQYGPRLRPGQAREILKDIQ